MGRAPEQPAIHDPFGHLYLRMIMMVLTSIAAISFVILLLYSLPSCLRLRTTHSRKRVWEQGPPPRIRPTPAPTPTRTVAIARPRGCFTACMHHRFHRRRTSHSSSRPSPCSSSPNLLPLSTVATASRPTLVDAGTGKSVLLLAFLCACRRRGHDGACHA
jgi:hypothetical protein